jgi:hypothetical protein
MLFATLQTQRHNHLRFRPASRTPCSRDLHESNRDRKWTVERGRLARAEFARKRQTQFFDHVLINPGERERWLVHRDVAPPGGSCADGCNRTSTESCLNLIENYNSSGAAVVRLTATPLRAHGGGPGDGFEEAFWSDALAT